MVPNVGRTDRILRIVAGLGLAALGFAGDGALRWIGLAGPVLIVTAFVRFCPAYWLLGLRTCARAPDAAPERAPSATRHPA